MQKKRPIFLPVLLILAVILAGSWFLWKESATAGNDPLQASGTIEAKEVTVAPETSGKALEVLVDEGQVVEAGQELFRIDDELLQAQKARLQAAVDAAQAAQDTAQKGVPIAQAGVDLAQAQLQTAQATSDLASLQYQRALNAASLANEPARSEAWRASVPNEFDKPVWYFQKDEAIQAAEDELNAASQVLEAEKNGLATSLKNAGGDSLIQAETRLAKAQEAFQVATGVLDQARTASEGADLENYAQQLYDSADSELKSAQKDYGKLLTEQQASDVLEARARVRVAQEWYDTTRDRLSQLQTGDQSLEVQIAAATQNQAAAALAQSQAALAQAKARLTQAQAGLTQAGAVVIQAQADLKVMDLQLERLVIKAPVAGVILQRSIEPGELAQAGATTFNIGELDHLTITVYLPEDRYGEVHLSDKAQVAVDSFPGKVFEASVSRIADQAEFTPRNVQTVEGRKTTVFAIELTVNNQDGLLKPGMPADVTFGK